MGKRFVDMRVIRQRMDDRDRRVARETARRKNPPKCNHCSETYPCRGVLWGTHSFKGDQPK